MIKTQFPEIYLTNYTHPLGSTKTDSNKNIILSKRVRLGRGCHANDHVAVIGKDLSHMVRSVAVPNVLQCCGSRSTATRRLPDCIYMPRRLPSNIP